MKINAIKCTKCGDTIFSRANHDFARCSCGAIAIDGGQTNKYYGINAEPDDMEGAEFELDVTLKELYDDWNYGRDKYGLIKETK